jgi:DNA-binding NarL/FixJ family response regulator
MLLDPRPLVRGCLVSALREEAGGSTGSVRPTAAPLHVEAAASVEAALARLAEGRPGEAADVLLVGGSDAAELERIVRAARAAVPRLKVLVLGAEEEREEALALLRAGANGYLFRDASLPELRTAIAEVAAGATVCTPRVADLLFSRLAELGRLRRRDAQLEALELTGRELEVLRLVAEGLKNGEIAARLHLSVHTVKNHVHNIIERLGVDGRWSAVSHACDKGWLRPQRRFPA